MNQSANSSCEKVEMKNPHENTSLVPGKQVHQMTEQERGDHYETDW